MASIPFTGVYLRRKARGLVNPVALHAGFVHGADKVCEHNACCIKRAMSVSCKFSLG